MKVWIYLDGRQQGPFEFEQLADIPGITENTKVWFEGLPKWYAAGSLEQMRPLFDGTLRSRAPQEAQSETADTAEQQAECQTESPGESRQPEAAADTQQNYRPANTMEPGRRYIHPRPGEPCPPTYLGWSVFLLICCCSPVSLASIAASICVSSYYNAGRLDKARKASEIAAWLIMIAFALGAIPMMLMSAIF